jgi:hypothetical protein
MFLSSLLERETNPASPGGHDDQGRNLDGRFGAACAAWEGLRNFTA